MKAITKGVKIALGMAAAATVLASASSAAAATGTNSRTAAVASHSSGTSRLGSCPQTYFCFWVNSNYTGDRGKFAGVNAFWGDFKDSECVPPAAAPDAHGTWNDCASSGWNNGTSTTVGEVVVWQNSNQGGGAYCIAQGSGSAEPDFASVHYMVNQKPISATLNDSISSNSWTGPEQCREIDT